MNAKEFDQKFDDGEEDIIEMLDLSQAKRPLATQKMLSIELPIWMIELVNQEAKRLGVTPQVVVQNSVADHLATKRKPRALTVYKGERRGIRVSVKGFDTPQMDNNPCF